MIPKRRLLDVGVRGLAVSVPKRIVETPEGRFKKLTGIERRRVAPPGMYVTNLAEPAINQLLDAAGWERDSVSSLIMVTQTPEMAVPSTACIMHGRLGLPNTCAAFDINLGCSGYVYGLSIAGNFVDYDNARSILVVGEVTGKIKEHTYAPMFGDAVSVTLLEYTPNENMIIELMTDGSRADVISERCMHGSPDVESIIEDDKVKIDTHYTLKGEDVYQFSVREAPAAVKRMAEYSGVPIEKLDAVVFHQANQIINKTLQKRLKLRDDQVPSTLKDFGNTSSATIPLTLVEHMREKISGYPGASVQLCGFGVGLSWGTAYLKLRGVKCLPLIEL